jgi:hypothetical protein
MTASARRLVVILLLPSAPFDSITCSAQLGAETRYLDKTGHKLDQYVVSRGLEEEYIASIIITNSIR